MSQVPADPFSSHLSFAFLVNGVSLRRPLPPSGRVVGTPFSPPLEQHVPPPSKFFPKCSPSFLFPFHWRGPPAPGMPTSRAIFVAVRVNLSPPGKPANIGPPDSSVSASSRPGFPLATAVFSGTAPEVFLRAYRPRMTSFLFPAAQSDLPILATPASCRASASS